MEGGDRVLATFDPALSVEAERALHAMGVEVKTKTRVTAIDAEGISAGTERIEASTVLWAAGVRAVSLAEEIGLPVDRQGRVKVLSDCSIDGHPEVFCIGDAAVFVPEGSEHPLPGVSPVAMPVFNTSENITSGALSAIRRPLRTANPKFAGVPTR